ncbi:sodium-dependent noradrenaline transporter-like [Daktulosphaira vitifoliae]|uniref:sodium-dependent noradrenaline transporter-like n=1 Tax=Daktulosphaira vitifoliae TaxID=58002 RepID=UPI0021AAAEB7|nr:sodium-dependent noradrenaline transporter-like [Daktulosphaira vitifoliae]
MAAAANSTATRNDTSEMNFDNNAGRGGAAGQGVLEGKSGSGFFGISARKFFFPREFFRRSQVSVDDEIDEYDYDEDDGGGDEDDEEKQVRISMLQKSSTPVYAKKNTEVLGFDDGHIVSIIKERTVDCIGGDPLRETWERNADFLLSIIGFAVDLANIWRFPYLCYRNGGGAFLIPYALMLIFGAVPLFYMELILGQYNRQGPVSVWTKICPLFKGVGFCAVLVAFYVSFYYNVIIGWSLYFLAMSVNSPTSLPWVHCNNTWNTINCIDRNVNLSLIGNSTLQDDTISPAAEYFHRGVLEMSENGLDNGLMGWPKWQLAICVFIVYVMLYLSLFKGVKSSGIVVWGTATLPYLVLTILLIRGLMLPGSLTGIAYYLKPELGRLLDTQVWVDAAVQIFYSVGAGFGVHLSYASYNNIKNNCYTDCLITTAVNCFTSFFSGFVIFTYLGYMSHQQQKPISSVATEGPGLVFQVYPEAVATLPGSCIWAVLFFFMAITLGIDSAMGGLECVITGLMDEFPRFFKHAGEKYGNLKKSTWICWSREQFTFLIIAMSFCVALINVTPSGIYILHLLDTYAAGISLLCSALFECVAVSWFYGLEKFSKDVEEMYGHRPGPYWRICWKFLSPLFILSVVCFAVADHQTLKYNGYKYPVWAEYIGWSLTLSSILMIPIVGAFQLYKAPCSSFKDKLAYTITPKAELELRQIEYNNARDPGGVTRFKLRHWLYV